MATRFVRVDLSAGARNYRPIAIEPGMALLDPANTHSKILLRWLGRLAAEPVWEQNSVNFFVRDDAGGRLEEIVCQPATREDLEGPLADDLAALKNRVARAKAETPGEEALLKSLRQSLGQLLDNPNRTDLDSYFFRYRDATGRWRLVWCWGFQRSDGEPAPAVVCTDTDCNLLFVRRPKQSPKCPSCAAVAERKAHRRSPVGLMSLLLLLILLGLVAWWWEHRPRITVTPENPSLIVGELVELKVSVPVPPYKTPGFKGAIGIADPSIVEVQGGQKEFYSSPVTIIGRKVGSTQIVAREGDYERPCALRSRKAKSCRSGLSRPYWFRR